MLNNWKSAKEFEMLLDVVAIFYSKNESSCSVLHMLEFREKSVWKADGYCVSVVYTRKDKKINKTFDGKGV
jgi:hypothetical protein